MPADVGCHQTAVGGVGLGAGADTRDANAENERVGRGVFGRGIGIDGEGAGRDVCPLFDKGLGGTVVGGGVEQNGHIDRAPEPPLAVAVVVALEVASRPRDPALFTKMVASPSMKASVLRPSSAVMLAPAPLMAAMEMTSVEAVEVFVDVAFSATLVALTVKLPPA